MRVFVKQETAVMKRFRAGRRTDKNKTQKTTKYKARNVRHWLSVGPPKRRQSSWSLWELLEWSFSGNPLYSAISSWISSYSAPSPPWQWSCVRESCACAVAPREPRRGATQVCQVQGTYKDRSDTLYWRSRVMDTLLLWWFTIVLCCENDMETSAGQNKSLAFSSETWFAPKIDLVILRNVLSIFILKFVMWIVYKNQKHTSTI